MTFDPVLPIVNSMTEGTVENQIPGARKFPRKAAVRLAREIRRGTEEASREKLNEPPELIPPLKTPLSEANTESEK